MIRDVHTRVCKQSAFHCILDHSGGTLGRCLNMLPQSTERGVELFMIGMHMLIEVRTMLSKR